MANVNARSSKQNQDNIDESQRDVVRKQRADTYNPQLQDLKRIISKNSLKNGLIKRRRSLL